MGLRFCVATADSDDQQLISNLLDIKKKSRRGKSREFNCEDLVVNGDPIHQMFVISGAETDTLFVDKSNQWIIFPDKHKAYFDKDQKFAKALTGIIKEFVEYDFLLPYAPIIFRKKGILFQLGHYYTTGAQELLL